MKRSKAPSVMFANKAPRLDTNEKGRDKEKDAPPVNHLALYAPKKEVEKEKENEEPAEMDQQPTKKGKNVRMTETSTPLYFLAYYKSKQKFDDKQGYGVLELQYGAVYLYSKSCKQIGKATLTRSNDDDEKNQIVKIKTKEVWFQEGYSVPIGNKDVSVRTSVTPEEFKNGQVFLKMHEFVKKEKLAGAKGEVVKKRILLAAARRPKTGKFVIPYKGGAPVSKRLTKPLHNPLEKDALVLFKPQDLFSENKVAVVVDPILSAKLRPHQRIGVQFMFDCCLGLAKGIRGCGCILADDMGLGKSIQAIALLWSLLKQGPTGEPGAKRAVIVAPSSLVGNWVNELKKWLGDRIKAVAIGESTKKGSVRLGQVKSGEADVLVISYDQLRIYQPELLKVPQIELIICDEGHKLKNAEIKTTKAVASLPGKRRVILSGTPIQNNLDEFYAMVNFVNPEVLGDIETFRNTFQIPIEASRVPDALTEERELGRQRSIELSRLTGQFILRRTAHVNQKYLPPKAEYTVFCKLTDMQKSIYKRLTDEIKSKCPTTTAGALPMITSLKKLCNCPELIHPSISEKKKAAAKMRQEQKEAAELCDDEPRRPSRGGAKKNYAEAFGDDGGEEDEEKPKGRGGRGKKAAAGGEAPKKGRGGKAKSGGDGEEKEGAVPFSLISDLYPADFRADVWQPHNSGKMLFLDRLLAEIRATTNDRVVIISNYTQTLEVLSLMCETRKYPFFRLDGQTPPAKRTKLVDLFNDPTRPEFIFLLSSKAGGVGLNLIGGNHLVLFDPDWNPANDAQAMARVWREGQKKNVSIYRTLSTGSIEEKIFQRQITKKALSNSVVGGDTDNAPDFSPKDLKDIFSMREDTLCDTHDMLGCRCSKAKKLPPHVRGKVSIGELDQYEHYDTLENIKNNKELQKSGADVVTFVMVNTKLPEPIEKKAPRGEEDIVVEHAVSLEDSDFKPKEEDEDGDYKEGEKEDEKEEEVVESESEESESEEESEEESDESDD